MLLKETVFVFAAVFVFCASATKVNPCSNAKAIEDTNQVKITNCETPPCKLKRRTRVGIEQKFTPDHDVKSLTTSVQANILGIPLPFVGVDGTSACDNVFNADGTKAGCPLKAGTEYIYKNEFPVLQLYPTVSLVVHWALMEGNKNIACFEIPSRITG